MVLDVGICLLFNVTVVGSIEVGGWRSYVTVIAFEDEATAGVVILVLYI